LFDPTQLTDDRLNELAKSVRFNANIRDLPRNSIIGRRIQTGLTEISGIEVFFPMFSSHLSLPIKAGEQVWIFFEDPTMTDAQGYWISRIAEVRSVEDVNHTHADRKFDRRASKRTSEKSSGGKKPVPGFNNGVIGSLDGDDVSMTGTASIPGGPKAYEDIMAAAQAESVEDHEPVPRFNKRPGDFVAQGSNNTLLVLGTDRTGPAANYSSGTATGKPSSDKSGKAGTITLVAGRGQKDATAAPETKNSLGNSETDKSSDSEKSAEGDLDLDNDISTLIISMRTSADKNFKIKHSALNDTSKDEAGAIAIKTDQLRFLVRQDIKFLVKATPDTSDDDAAMFVIKTTGDIVLIPSKNGLIKLGGDDADLAVLCQTGAPAAGNVEAAPIIDSMGGQVGAGGANGQFARKVVMK
jgi:hypothetical protein